ncbi:hypothetical protein FQN50_008792, partial [Emmonsiellopsis sp. PD_5]
MPKLNRTIHDLSTWLIASALGLLIIYPIYHANRSLKQYLSPSHPLLVTYILNPLYTILTLTIVFILVAQTLIYISLADGKPWQNRDEFSSYIKGMICRNFPPPPPKQKETPRRPVQPVFVKEDILNKSRSRTWSNWMTTIYASRPWRRRRDSNNTKILVQEQERSPFFSKLPLEIRWMIYHYALGGEAIHIMYRHYLESIDILYTTNHFNFPSLSTLVKFLTTIPASRLNSLSSISTHERMRYTRIFESTLSHLYEHAWKPLLQILASKQMAALRHVRMILGVDGGLTGVWRFTEEQERWFFGLLREDGEIGKGIGEKVERGGLEVVIRVSWELSEGTLALLPGACRV